MQIEAAGRGEPGELHRNNGEIMRIGFRARRIDVDFVIALVYSQSWTQHDSMISICAVSAVCDCLVCVVCMR
jgi:hypothetical protein